MKSQTKSVAVIVAFALIGVILLMIVRAATTNISVESAEFSVSSPASMQSSPTASGNSFVAFKENSGGGVKDQGVVVIGDSLLHQRDAYKTLQNKLISRGWAENKIDMNAIGCRATGAEHICGSSFVPYLIHVLGEVKNNTHVADHQPAHPSNGRIAVGDLNSGFREASTVVIALGTNDKPPVIGTHAQKITTSVNLMRELNPDVDIYWVKPCDFGPANGRQQFNAALEQVVSQLNIKLINWQAACQNSSYFNSATDLHYNPTGAEAYTETMAAGVEP